MPISRRVASPPVSARRARTLYLRARAALRDEDRRTLVVAEIMGDIYEALLVRLEREDGLPRIVVRDIASGAEHAIAFAEEAYALGISSGFEFDTTALRFIYSSMTTPAEVYDYDMVERTRVSCRGISNVMS